MIPLRHLMPGAVAAVIRKAPLTPEKVAFAWRSVVGPAIDNVTSIRWLDKGVLVVYVRDAAWRREIERSAGLIRSRLETLLGKRAVVTIHVRLK